MSLSTCCCCCCCCCCWRYLSQPFHSRRPLFDPNDVTTLPTTYFSEPIQYTPMYEVPYYVIHPTAISVSGVDLGFTVTDFTMTGNTILDNGATNMFFPTAVYNAIMTKLNANVYYNSYFGSLWATAGPCIAYPTSPFNTPFLNANLPNITITWESGANMTIRPVDGYLQQILKGDLVYYCNNIASTSGSMRLGMAAHAQFIFQYDRPNHRFGFARTKTCDNYWSLTTWSSCCSGMQHRVPFCADRFGNRIYTRSDNGYMCQESNPFSYADMNQACTGTCTSCPTEVDVVGLTWSAAELTTQTQNCPVGYQGTSSRFCDFGGVWRATTSSTDCLPVPIGFKLLPDSQSIPQSLISPLQAQPWNSAGAVGNVVVSIANNLTAGVVMSFVAWDCTALAEDPTLNATTGCTNGTMYRLRGYSSATTVTTYNGALIISAAGYAQIWVCTSNPLKCVNTQDFPTPSPPSNTWGTAVAPGGTLLAVADPGNSLIRVYRCFNFTASPPCTTSYVTIPTYSFVGLGIYMAMSSNGILAVTASGNTNIVLLFDCTLTDPLSCTYAKNLTISSAAAAPLKFVGTKLVIIEDSWIGDWSGSSVPTMLVYNCPLDAASCIQLANTTRGLINGVVFKALGLSMAVQGNLLALSSGNAKPLAGSNSIVLQGAFVLMISDDSPGGFTVLTAASPTTLVNSGKFGQTVGITPGIIAASSARMVYSDARPLWVMNTCDMILPGSRYNSIVGSCILPTPVTPPVVPSPPPTTPVAPPVVPSAPPIAPPISAPISSPQSTPSASSPTTSPTSSSPPSSSPSSDIPIAAPSTSPSVSSPTAVPSATPSSTTPSGSGPSLQPEVGSPAPNRPTDSPSGSSTPVSQAPQGISASSALQTSGAAIWLAGVFFLFNL